jgi:hypothetical protein
MQKIEQLRIVPKIGQLYSFRTDNIEYLHKKYGYHYKGLVMCIEEDILKYINKSEESIEYKKNNILYRFETYKCEQIYAHGHIYNNKDMESIIKGNIFLSISDIQDMLELPKKGDI